MQGEPTLFSRLTPLRSPVGLLVACLSLCGHEAAAQSRSRAQADIHMPPGAFLHRSAANVGALVQQVKTDSKVTVRYARLFHLPVKMVPLAFAQLHPKTLTADHVYQVHYVTDGKHDSEKLIYKPRRVKAGTPVYCLPDGTPLLVKICGNPIRTRVSPELYTAAPVPEFKPNEAVIPPTATDSTTVAAVPVGHAVTPPTTPLPVIPVVLAENVLAPAELPVVPPAMTAPAMKAASLPPVYNWVHGGPGLAGLAGLAPLALLPLLHFGGSSGTAALPIPASPVVPGTSAEQTSPAAPPAGTGPIVVAPVLPGTGESSSGTETGPVPVLSVLPQTPGTPGGSPEVPIIPTAPGGSPQVTPEPGSLAFAVSLLMGAGWIARKRKG